jgi:hypothetical protein
MARKLFVYMIGIGIFFLSTVYCFGATLKWDKVTGDGVAYRLYYGYSPGSYQFQEDVGDALQYEISALNLEAGVTYYFVVRAYNAYGESGDSKNVPYTVPSGGDTTPPVSPSELSVAIVGKNAELAWKASVDIDISGYNVYFGTESRKYGSAIPTGNTTMVSIPGLQEGNTYYFSVTAVDSSQNESGYSDELVFNFSTTSEALVLSNLAVASGKPYEIKENVDNGVVPYIDRSWYEFSGIPEFLLGSHYIVTAMDDKSNRTNPFLFFDVNLDVTVYIASDDRILTKPTWLSEFSETEYDIVSSNKPMSLFKKDFSSGTISLGANERGYSMYNVIVVGKSSAVADVEPPVILFAGNQTSLETSSPTIGLSGTASDNVGISQVLWVNSAGGDGTATGTESWSIEELNLVEGNNEISITARDAAGNESKNTILVVYTVPDTMAPSVIITSPTTDSSYNTTSSSLGFAGSASDDKGVTQVLWSNSAGGSGTVAGTNNWSLSGVTLVEGDNQIFITARDAAGNESTDTLLVVYTVPDKTPPAVTIMSPTTDSSYNTASESIDIGGSASDNKEVTQVIWSNSTGGSGTAAGTTSWSVSGLSLGEGSNLIKITARDASGNESTDNLTVTYTPPDTAVPLISITSPTTGSSYNSASPSLVISGSASDNRGVNMVIWSNSAGGSGTATGKDSWSVDDINLIEGENVITITAVDEAGNFSSTVLTVTYAADTQKPTLGLSSPTTGGFFFTRNANVNLAGTASDNNVVAQVKWINSKGGDGVASGSTNWSVTDVALSPWWNTITITAIDNAGNEASINLTIFSWQ